MDSLPSSGPLSMAVAVIASACIGAGVVAWSYGAKLAKREEEFTAASKIAEDRFWSERKGRIAAERKLREDLQDANAKSQRFAPIGKVLSPFPRRVGTPRQGGLVASRATLLFDNRVAPKQSLEGLEAYSHLWIIFEFHENTNAASDVVKSKVRPPRGGGAKVGLYATRTPHRHNAIGLSLVKIESVSIKEQSVSISGGDLLDGTPILDVKPYIPSYESIPEAKVPAWVAAPVVAGFKTVSFSDTAREQIKTLCDAGSLRFYRKGEAAEVYDVLTRLLLVQDIRSHHQKEDVDSPTYQFPFDNMTITLKINSDSIAVDSVEKTKNKAKEIEAGTEAEEKETLEENSS